MSIIAWFEGKKYIIFHSNLASPWNNDIYVIRIARCRLRSMQEECCWRNFKFRFFWKISEVSSVLVLFLLQCHKIDYKLVLFIKECTSYWNVVNLYQHFVKHQCNSLCSNEQFIKKNILQDQLQANCDNNCTKVFSNEQFIKRNHFVKCILHFSSYLDVITWTSFYLFTKSLPALINH